jgi:hypothetical protein
VNDATVDSALSKRKAAGFTMLPVAPNLTQSVQLHCEPLERSTSASNFTSPQRQLPWCLVGFVMSPSLPEPNDSSMSVIIDPVRRAVIVARSLLFAWSLMGCSHLGRMGVGPVAVRGDDADLSVGDELRLRTAAGSSDGKGLMLVEAQGRLVVSQRSQALSFGLGPTYLHWLGPAALTLSGAPALGIENFDRTVYATAGLHGGAGLGVVLSNAVHERSSMPGLMALRNEPGYIAITRRRTLLTLELTGAADARTSGASLAVGLLIGLAWSDEQYTQAIREAPWWPLFTR